MRQHVIQQAPVEACGLLGGQKDGTTFQAELVIPTKNSLQSTSRYQIDPQEQINAFEAFEQAEMDLVAIYHSHPDGPEWPSPTDIAEAYYPEAVYLIWFKRNQSWHCLGYSIQNSNVKEVNLEIAG